MKAFTYTRVSGIAQVNGDGLDRQKLSVEKYASSHGVEIEREFREEGVSGTKDAFSRPALNELFAAIRANGVRLVLVERADRLARDLMVSEIILSEMRKLGVKVIECEGGNDLTVCDNEPTKILIRQILAAVAQFQKCVDVQKMKAAKDRIRAKGGKAEGQFRYGSDPEHPEERPWIARAKELRTSHTLREIAAILSLEGAPLRHPGSRWSASQVMRVVKRV